MSILIAGGENSYPSELRAWLERLGCRISGVAVTEEDALAKAAAQPPDLTLLSDRLPGSSGAVETAARLRAASGVEIILLSSCAEPETSMRLQGSGVLGWLAEPFGERELRSCILMAVHWRDSERARHAAEERFRIVWNESADGIRVTDSEGAVLQANPVYCHMVGLPREDVEGHPMSDIYLEEHRHRILKEHQRRFITRTVKPRVEAEVTLWNGNKIWLNVSNVFVERPGAEPLLMGFFRNTTPRKREERRQTVFAALPGRLQDAVTAKDVASLILEVAEDLFGWDYCSFQLYDAPANRLHAVLQRTDMPGDRVTTPVGDAEGGIGFLGQQILIGGPRLCLRGESEFDEAVLRLFAGPRRHPASVMLAPMCRGVTPFALVSIQSCQAKAYLPEDLSLFQELVSYGAATLERIQAKAAMLESERRYHCAMSNVRDAIVIDDLEGRLVFANDRFFDLFGFSRDELPRLRLEDYAAPEQRVELRARHERLMRNEEVPEHFEFEGLRRDGQRLWLEARVWKVSEHGKTSGTQSIIRDVSDHKRSEKEREKLQIALTHSSKMEAIGHLAGGVAHDFNNILTGILLHLNTLQEKQAPNSEMRSALNELESEAHRASNLTRQLLTFSQRQLLQPRPTELGSVVVQLLKMLGRLIGEHINLEIEGASNKGSAWVLADPGMMDQIVMNLVVNARDAMPSGGRITLSTQVVDVDEADRGRHPDAHAGQFAVLSVTDTGCGMAPETMARIFEPFFTTKLAGKGTGLGLATVHGIVSQHKGWVEVESSLGVGSTFRVFLPALRSGAPSERVLEPVKSMGRGEMILIVEDESIVRWLVMNVLIARGYNVIEAKSGPEALQLFRSAKDSIQLMLTDMVMPGGMTGLDLTQTLRQEIPELKVVVMSGYNMEWLNQDTSGLSRVSYLPKPFTTDMLVETVKKALS